MPDRGHYELIDGELRERPSSHVVSIQPARFRYGISGRPTATTRSWAGSWQYRMGYRCFPWKPRPGPAGGSVLHPAERFTPEQWSDGYVTIPPDLAVEVVSPTDLVDYELDEKVEDYLRAGVKLSGWFIPEATSRAGQRGDGTGDLAAVRTSFLART